MRWNYTKSLGVLLVAWSLMGLVTGKVGEAFVGALMALPIMVIADIVSWWRARDKIIDRSQ